jgi:IclR family acetate operon transcriptional repressor
MVADPAGGAFRPVNSVARAMKLIDVLARADSGMGVNELARSIGVSPSTASRLLATLETGRLVERDSGGPYRLGVGLLALADQVLARLDVREIAHPLLERLVAETGETATLSVPGEEAAITVDFVLSDASIMSVARLWEPSVAHATAVGKVMLAFRQAGPATGDGSALAAFTERTITDRSALASELQAVRRRGYAEAVREREPDLNAVAVPVHGRAGSLVAILGLQGPATRLTGPKRRELHAVLRSAATEVEIALGAR